MMVAWIPSSGLRRAELLTSICFHYSSSLHVCLRSWWNSTHCPELDKTTTHLSLLLFSKRYGFRDDESKQRTTMMLFIFLSSSSHPLTEMDLAQREKIVLNIRVFDKPVFETILEGISYNMELDKCWTKCNKCHRSFSIAAFELALKDSKGLRFFPGYQRGVRTENSKVSDYWHANFSSRPNTLLLFGWPPSSSPFFGMIKRHFSGYCG